ncbi:VCBS repeat-containing protein, partial [Akkermansiaceae bacterium]|nr:VCBS repeat-containing protein [Akkermansiaceae bacterium]
IESGYSPTASDYDLDGDLDLLILRYNANSREVGDFPTPHPFHNARNGGANVLLKNEGQLRFSDVTQESGLGKENFRFSFAAAWEDYDNDGDSDLYIANDFGPNQLLRNDGGKFIDTSVESLSQDWGFGMSVSWGDLDRDGNMDLYVSSMFSGAGNLVIPQDDFNPSMPKQTPGPSSMEPIPAQTPPSVIPMVMAGQILRKSRKEVIQMTRIAFQASPPPFFTMASMQKTNQALQTLAHFKPKAPLRGE